jgi:hypothetical protein
MPQAIAPATTPNLFLSPFMAQLQQQFGSFDPNKVQTRRRGYYSFNAYPAAGQSSFTFFSNTVGQSDLQLTNLQRSGHLDNPLIVRAIRTRYYITNQNHQLWAGTDATTLFSDIVNGLFQVGVLRVFIGSKEWLQVPAPFLYAPPAYGIPQVFPEGVVGAGIISHAPYAYLGHGRMSGYLVDPSFMIGSDQNFQISIEYPSGLVPVIATTIVTNDTTLYIGVELDGVEVRPLQ